MESAPAFLLIGVSIAVACAWAALYPLTAWLDGRKR